MNPPALSERRSFLRWATVALAGLNASWPTRANNSSFKLDPFLLGVASGSPRADSVVLWTRLVGPDLIERGSVPVHWEIWEEGPRNRIVSEGTALALEALGHSVHVEVSGLQPNRWYTYRFMVQDAVSVSGRTRTLPAAGEQADKWRMTLASCQRWEDGFYAAYQHMLADQPDLVLFVGDYIYESAARKKPGYARTHNLARIKNLQDYRDRYALYKSDVHLQRMHAACPWLVTWDDHEVENNYAGLLSTSGHASFPSLRYAAYQAYYEHMPLSRKALVKGIEGLLAAEELRLYDAIDIGNLARIHLLDNRQYRDVPLCGKTPTDKLAQVCVQQASDSRSMLGAAQEQWLQKSLEQATQLNKKWNLIVQQTRFTPANYGYGLGQRFNPDTWDGYPETRGRVISALKASGAKNPVILGGDIHQNWVAHVHADPYNMQSPVIASEFIGTSISSSTSADASQNARQAFHNPHCLLSDSAYRGYALLELSQTRLDVSLRVLSDPKDPDATVSNLAAFSVNAGSPRIVRGG